MEVDYLGIKLSSHGRVENEVRELMNKSYRAGGRLNDTVWRMKRIKSETYTP